ncbi:MAG TPA: sigma-54-dependent Fis family transcriptional regulator [Bacteroidales bacterium]|nr:MAG: hypothetical protein A2X11_04310 [Bacteroidetes bacterium GWE2_42_24]OFY25248.1 MAG: hypothetical protein A2X09_10985 [Bacteroidetes bacterium GWF2_43_11]HAQ65934.1 sigma-54-dependent Fis family transcriptional regulator [Bacteroidales bacterium]HBZ66950.1 sigma-54-dependent Fis family transcriptional regulator [Bacteroidales bacterium]
MNHENDQHRQIIDASHERSRRFGVMRSQRFPSQSLAPDELAKQIAVSIPFIDLALPVVRHLYEAVRGSGYFIVLTDAGGCILHVIGDDEVIDEAQRLNMVTGAFMTEESIGTNAMGTALRTDKPIQVNATEHFIDAYHRWTCSAAPIHNPDGDIIGTLNLTGHAHDVHPHTLGLVIAAKEAIESKFEGQIIQHQLSEANQYAFTLMNNLSFGVFAIDLNDEIHWVNDTACRSLNIRRQLLINRQMSLFYKEWAVVKRKILLGETFLDEEGRIIIEGVDEKFIVNSYPIKTPENEILGFMITLREYRRMLSFVNKYAGSHARYTFQDIIGISAPIQQVISYARKVAPGPSSVLITGESGTGKEVFAQAIHNASSRHEGSFIAINCGAISTTLIESELFGYEDGAFTGARKGGRPGKFELADKGTLFLDEIGEMPLEMQVKLLRTIQEGSVTRIGGEKEIKVDVRIIAATNKNLSEEVRKGRFRLDLFYRLNVIPLRIPALRERREDIRALVKFFLKQKATSLGKNIPYLSPTLMEKVLDYQWPGNIRELENFIEKAVLLDGNILNITETSLSQIPDHQEEQYPPQQVVSEDNQPLLSIEEAEREAILRAIKRLEGNISKAARVLKISRNTLYLKMKKYDIPF